ncbi:MAG: non-canonical purine NTP pyrophosphatase [Patescibacteria group bacterium]
MEIILATRNIDKLKHFSIFFKDLGLSLALPREEINVDEDLPTLKDNAEKKALTYSDLYPQQFIIASDGGITIPYLGNNWNHVLTRRLSGLDATGVFTDRQRCEALLALLKNAKGDERRVSWREAYAVARGGRILFSGELSGADNQGILLDYIPDDFQESGYWIGYVWYDPRFKKTFMRLTDEEKKSRDSAMAQFMQVVRERNIFKQ